MHNFGAGTLAKGVEPAFIVARNLQRVIRMKLMLIIIPDDSL